MCYQKIKNGVNKMKPTNRNHEKKRKIITLSDMLYDKYTNLAITVRSIRLERANKARVESALKELKRAVDDMDKGYNSIQFGFEHWKSISNNIARMRDDLQSENEILKSDNTMLKWSMCIAWISFVGLLSTQL